MAQQEPKNSSSLLSNQELLAYKTEEERGQQRNIMISLGDSEWKEMYAYFEDTVHKNVPLHEILVHNFSQHEYRMFAPSEREDIQQMQLTNTIHFRKLCSGKFKDVEQNLATKLTMMYFGLPVSPFPDMLDNLAIQIDARETEPDRYHTRPPLHFLTAHVDRNYGKTSMQGREDHFDPIPIPNPDDPVVSDIRRQLAQQNEREADFNYPDYNGTSQVKNMFGLKGGALETITISSSSDSDILEKSSKGNSATMRNYANQETKTILLYGYQGVVPFLLNPKGSYSSFARAVRRQLSIGQGEICLATFIQFDMKDAYVLGTIDVALPLIDRAEILKTLRSHYFSTSHQNECCALFVMKKGEMGPLHWEPRGRGEANVARIEYGMQNLPGKPRLLGSGGAYVPFPSNAPFTKSSIKEWDSEQIQHSFREALVLAFGWPPAGQRFHHAFFHLVPCDARYEDSTMIYSAELFKPSDLVAAYFTDGATVFMHSMEEEDIIITMPNYYPGGRPSERTIKLPATNAVTAASHTNQQADDAYKIIQNMANGFYEESKEPVDFEYVIVIGGDDMRANDDSNSLARVKIPVLRAASSDDNQQIIQVAQRSKAAGFPFLLIKPEWDSEDVHFYTSTFPARLHHLSGSLDCTLDKLIEYVSQLWTFTEGAEYGPDDEEPPFIMKISASHDPNIEESSERFDFCTFAITHKTTESQWRAIRHHLNLPFVKVTYVILDEENDYSDKLFGEDCPWGARYLKVENDILISGQMKQLSHGPVTYSADIKKSLEDPSNPDVFITGEIAESEYSVSPPRSEASASPDLEFYRKQLDDLMTVDPDVSGVRVPPTDPEPPLTPERKTTQLESGTPPSRQKAASTTPYPTKPSDTNPFKRSQPQANDITDPGRRSDIEREKSWTNEPSMFGSHKSGRPVTLGDIRIPIHAPPAESIFRTTSSVPMVSKGVLTPTEQRRMQKSLWDIRNIALQRVLTCPYKNCDFAYKYGEDEEVEDHLNKVHLATKCLWCDEPLFQWWSEEQRSRHMREKHRWNLMEALGVDTAELRHQTGNSVVTIPLVRSTQQESRRFQNMVRTHQQQWTASQSTSQGVTPLRAEPKDKRVVSGVQISNPQNITPSTGEPQTERIVSREQTNTLQKNQINPVTSASNAKKRKRQDDPTYKPGPDSTDDDGSIQAVTKKSKIRDASGHTTPKKSKKIRESTSGRTTLASASKTETSSSRTAGGNSTSTKVTAAVASEQAPVSKTQAAVSSTKGASISTKQTPVKQTGATSTFTTATPTVATRQTSPSTIQTPLLTTGGASASRNVTPAVATNQASSSTTRTRDRIEVRIPAPTTQTPASRESGKSGSTKKSSLKIASGTPAPATPTPATKASGKSGSAKKIRFEIASGVSTSTAKPSSSKTRGRPASTTQTPLKIASGYTLPTIKSSSGKTRRKPASSTQTPTKTANAKPASATKTTPLTMASQDSPPTTKTPATRRTAKATKQTTAGDAKLVRRSNRLRETQQPGTEALQQDEW